MKRWLLLFLVVAGCCLSAGCGGAKNEGEGARSAGGANSGSSSGGGGGVAGKTTAKADVVFAREAVEGLLGGDASVASAFDWENLKVPGANVGESYVELPDDEIRDEFHKDFIEKFSASFKRSGASVGDLKNWREAGREGERTAVAVDTTTGKTMRVFVVRRDGRQLVSELSIE
ncbi:MAG: mycoredoxin [Pyrinomonadaceae bacterium]|nr:mycoredoxin [Pyrinomonadaceae bacterium]